VSGGVAGAPTTLAEIGVRTNRDGTLAVDATTLTNALMKFPDTVEAMFADGKGASGKGVSAALTAISDAAINTTTGLGASTMRYTQAQADLSEDQADLAAAGTVMTTRLTAQFAAMDARVAAYKSTLTFLEQQVDAWNSE
jgi:flagellar hook-associated protein 2